MGLIHNTNLYLNFFKKEKRNFLGSIYQAPGGLFDKKDKFPVTTLRANNGEIILEASDTIRNIKAK